MERFKWMDTGKYKCLIQDFSNTKPDELKTLIEESHKQIKSHCQKNKAIVITNIQNTVFDKETTHILGEFAEKNKPYIQDSSMYGVEVYHKVAIQSIGKMKGRDFKLFKEKEEALKWLDDLMEK